ncbi:DNA-binding response regulator, NarL/FixJ family, contains REC and HTH domains [Parafrankia irregularis]|uniref:DNA-binding response regulator, NarL/FixJ family, contains REC and HTH domains n=1 Tax=Parafrankia irregularis TaxID=795642 RepID=A0A0S4QJF6_9ACTN|nr:MULTISPECIES: response regulator transcription factor [Parafrankia]CUU54956.1 DNA-binding response regulator, NarL/FixJ family, contains REC and HTH domains [Parafrankia irregularis]
MITHYAATPTVNGRVDADQRSRADEATADRSSRASPEPAAIDPSESLADILRIDVLVADHDPISRHVLSRVVRNARGQDNTLRLLGCVDSSIPVKRWENLSDADVVVLSTEPRDDSAELISEITARDISVLTVSTEWDDARLAAAAAAGATGFLVKDAEMKGLPVAVRAVGAGYTLLSPSLETMVRPAGLSAAPARAGSSGSRRSALTERELEVLSLLAQGMSTTETASVLQVSPATVKSHVSHALPKLGARNRLEAVLKIRSR